MMPPEVPLGFLSLVPVAVTLVLAFKTKNAIVSLLAGCAVGGVIAFISGAARPMELFLETLGTRDFIWITLIEVSVGVTIAFYMRSGVMKEFAVWASDRISTRRAASGFGWLLGVSIFFSANFTPLFCGPIAKPLTDKHRISRELLAYLLDSGSAPVCTLIPLSGWAAYIGGLLEGYGPISSAGQGVSVFIRAIPYNLYGIFAVALAGLLAFGVIPHFGPMKRAERRARLEGKVLRDGATPLAGEELDRIQPLPGKRSNVVAYLIVPVLIVLGVAVGSLIASGRVMILEAFLATVLYQAIALSLGGHFMSIEDLVGTAMTGVKAVLPAMTILALAYCINAVTASLGAQRYVISITMTWMTAGLLPVGTFLTGAVISFFTGTSWGTYAILSPLVLPIAMHLSGGTVSAVVLATVGAMVSGGLFGDHCSPISDTTCLSSFGAGSDHIDHVTTQLPYALTAAAFAAALFLLFGMALT
jgi:Na+/H+ antiporter NhaC